MLHLATDGLTGPAEDVRRSAAEERDTIARIGAAPGKRVDNERTIDYEQLLIIDAFGRGHCASKISKRLQIDRGARLGRERWRSRRKQNAARDENHRGKG